MRIYGRVPAPFPQNGIEQTGTLQYPNYRWVEVSTDAGGYDDYVYITALIQCFRLNLNESPFWANFGIPAKNAVMQQLQPDYYVMFIQSYFSQYFASLIIAKQPQTPNNTTPVYKVSIVRKNGSMFQTEVAL